MAILSWSLCFDAIQRNFKKKSKKEMLLETQSFFCSSQHCRVFRIMAEQTAQTGTN